MIVLSDCLRSSDVAAWLARRHIGVLDSSIVEYTPIGTGQIDASASGSPSGATYHKVVRLAHRKQKFMGPAKVR